MSLSLTADKKKALERIEKQCALLADTIASKREALVDLLLEYESFETATDEIWRSLDCLRNISKESQWLSSGNVDLLCTFFPVNLPLYSLMIFAVIPGFMANEVVVRPPNLMYEAVQKISRVLGLAELMPQIKFVTMERSLFNEAYVSIADVVLFTGRYENAKLVQQECPDALFVFNGAGVNPIVVTESADVDKAVEKTVEMRVFNSGQDCAGTDIIFVHEKVIEDFQEKLFKKLDTVKVGDYRDRNVRVGHIIKDDKLPSVKKFFDTHATSLVYGGKVDFGRGIVYPTVIKEDTSVIDVPTTAEFFAPVFYLVEYHRDDDLKRYFSGKTYRDGAMYVSVFGDTSYASAIPDSVILKNRIVNDVERGNNAYGGYGPRANYVSYRGVHHPRPLLISHEISAYLEQYAPRKKKRLFLKTEKLRPSLQYSARYAG